MGAEPEPTIVGETTTAEAVIGLNVIVCAVSVATLGATITEVATIGLNVIGAEPEPIIVGATTTEVATIGLKVRTPEVLTLVDLGFNTKSIMGLL